MGATAPPTLAIISQMPMQPLRIVVGNNSLAQTNNALKLQTVADFPISQRINAIVVCSKIQLTKIHLKLTCKYGSKKTYCSNQMGTKNKNFPSKQ
jgi:hypothetical protein